MRWPPQNQQHPSLRWAPPRPNTAEHGATTRPRSEAGATCSSSRRRSRGPPPGQWGGGSARLRRCRGETAAPAWHDAMSGPFISGAPRRHPGGLLQGCPRTPPTSTHQSADTQQGKRPFNGRCDCSNRPQCWLSCKCPNFDGKILFHNARRPARGNSRKRLA